MKKNIKLVGGVMLLTALLWTGCSDDDDPVTGTSNPELPTIEISEPALKQGTNTAVVTITPSEETEKWYWKCEEKGKNESDYSKLSGNEASKIEFPVDHDVNYELTAYAENKTGKSEVVKKEFSFSRTEVLGEMVEFEVKNLSPFSMDVVVKKNAYCARYVVAAIKTEAYTEESFKESAVTSLSPDKDYPIQPYNWSDKSATFDETTLYRGALATEDISKSEGVRLEQGTKYTVAIYAHDTEGEAKVFTKEVDVPKGTVNGNVQVQLDIEKAMRSFTAKVTAAGASKLIVNITEPYTYTTGDNPQRDKHFGDLQPDEVKAYLATVGAELPHRYKGPFTKVFSDYIEPEQEYAIYAIAIDETGKLGEVAYEVVTPAEPVYDGVGEILSVEIPEQTEIDKLTVKIEVNDQTKAIRIYHNTDPNKNYLIDWIMQDDKSGAGVFWTEYPVTGTLVEKELYIMHPGEMYYLFAVTKDKDGKFSEVVNLVEKAGLEGPGYKTKEEEEEEEGGISLNGKGEASIEVIKNEEIFEEGNPAWGTEDSYSYNVEIKVTKGANTKQVFVVYDDGVKPDTQTLEALVKDAIEFGWSKELLIDEAGTEAIDKFSGFAKYDPKWGGSGRIYLTLDDEGKYKIVDYFICGYEKP